MHQLTVDHLAMEQQRTLTAPRVVAAAAAGASENHAENYATSFQSEQQDHLMMMYQQHTSYAQPDYVSHPYASAHAPVKPTAETFLHNNNNNNINYHQHLRHQQHQLNHNQQQQQQQAVELSTSMQPPTALDTYCDLRATNGSGALAHHHHNNHQQQQQARKPQQQQLLIPQQIQRQQQQLQQSQRRLQFSSSQYPPYHDHRGLVVVSHNQQQLHLHNHHNQQQLQPLQVQQQQQQHQLAYTQFVDSQSPYYTQTQRQYSMDQVNNSDYRIGFQLEQSQPLMQQQQQDSQRIIAAPTNHHHYPSSQQTAAKTIEQLQLADQQQYLMSVGSDFSDREISTMNGYLTNDHMCNQSPTDSSATSLNHLDNNQDILNPAHMASAAADVANDQINAYMTHLKSDLDLEAQIPPTSSANSNSNSLKQTLPANMSEQYSTQICRSVPTQAAQMIQHVTSSNGVSMTSQVSLRQTSDDFSTNPSQYANQVMHMNYDGLVENNSQNDYDPTALRSSTANDIVQLQRPQQARQQHHQQRQHFVNEQSFYNSNRIAMNNSGQQREAPVMNNNSSNCPSTSNDRTPISRPLTNRKQDDFVELKSDGTVSQDWLDTICRHLIDHLDQFGICVIDNFLGPLKGDRIFKEVLQLYSNGQHTRGGLVNGNKLSSRNLGADAGVIRNDRVIWIDGYEEGCLEINYLIQTLCSVITNSARLSLYSNNGLDKIVINKRTKAHVACYPGNGTRYIKHVDNPNGDGRVITSIYYLNKNWNNKRDGGLLRMFPTGINEVANIEPLFDRVLFFWSDRRNPHEVLPAYRDRFAITVWYIGENRN